MALTDYERYQLEWMIDHGHSLGELMNSISMLQKDYEVAPDYDRTKWYALSDKGYALFAQLTAICQKRQMDLSEMTNGFVKNDKSNCQKPQMDLSETTNLYQI